MVEVVEEWVGAEGSSGHSLVCCVSELVLDKDAVVKHGYVQVRVAGVGRRGYVQVRAAGAGGGSGGWGRSRRGGLVKGGEECMCGGGLSR